MIEPQPRNAALRLQQHENYRRVVEKAQQSHEQNRSTVGIEPADVVAARLYSYAFRAHVIGAFHATRVALDALPPADPLATAYRQRASETLQDMASQSMEPIANNFQAVVSTFFRYHRGLERVLASFEAERRHRADPRLQQIADRFSVVMEAITAECGIDVTQDTHEPEQASFVVPGLGISIVPLVYGDHHSWNLAWLAGQERNVPIHRHRHGVEIHLGYDPTHGVTVLGDCQARVDDGYAMPIPPETDHGWVNTSEEVHHVPFIFGSLVHSGWGVFLDVQPSDRPVDTLRLVSRDSPQFSQMAYLERDIEQASRLGASLRRILIPYTVTHRGRSGGLELGLTRVNATGYQFPVGDFRAVSTVRGSLIVKIEGIERQVGMHDHFGIPAQLRCDVRQVGGEPAVLLDSTIKAPGR